MATVWLPYFAADGRPSPQRPPAVSLRPAVVIPLAVAALAISVAAASLALAQTPPLSAAPLEAVPEPLHNPVALPAFSPSVQAWTPEIMRWSAEHSLPAELVAVVMTLESCGDARARSGAGALGLFQVMPFHFSAEDDPLDPEVNADRGLAYLRRSLDLAQGDVGRALAGYNGGHGVIGRDPSTWAAETRRYVAWGTGILADLSSGRVPSPTLQAWLDAGGEHLCRRAEQ